MGEGAFKKQLWLCMAGMALKVKAEVEHYRSRNIFGLLVWQLNEVRACMRPGRIVIFLCAALRCAVLCCAVLYLTGDRRCLPFLGDGRSGPLEAVSLHSRPSIECLATTQVRFMPDLVLLD